MMPSMIERTCRCGNKFMARTADVKRGWGKSCSKSCAAIRTNKKTGNYARFQNRKARAENGDYEDDFHPFDSYSLGQW